jgi:hypothetical protein
MSFLDTSIDPSGLPGPAPAAPTQHDVVPTDSAWGGDWWRNLKTNNPTAYSEGQRYNAMGGLRSGNPDALPLYQSLDRQGLITHTKLWSGFDHALDKTASYAPYAAMAAAAGFAAYGAIGATAAAPAIDTSIDTAVASDAGTLYAPAAASSTPLATASTGLGTVLKGAGEVVKDGTTLFGGASAALSLFAQGKSLFGHKSGPLPGGTLAPGELYGGGSGSGGGAGGSGSSAGATAGVYLVVAGMAVLVLLVVALARR